MKAFSKMLVGLAMAAAAACAQATTVYGGTGELASPDTVSATFASAGGAATVSFTLNGYASLDGDNFYIDIFHLSLNGTEVFTGTFDMGGGGANRILYNPNGGTALPTSFGLFGGGVTDIMVPHSLLSGFN